MYENIQPYRAYLLALIVFLLYVNTLGHGFVLDDNVVLLQHPVVQKGIKGIPELFTDDSLAPHLKQLGIKEQIITGGRYRPFSLAIFACGVSLWGNHPLGFHVCNILLFLGSVLVFFHLLERLEIQSKWAFLIALLFAIHPIHTEVVANIKSADELWVFLLGGLAALLALRPVLRWTHHLGILLLLLLAFLSKETALAWVILIPIMHWLTYSSAYSSIKTAIVPVLAVGLYALMRFSAIENVQSGSMMHDPLNNPLIQVQGQWVSTNTTDSSNAVLSFKGVSRAFTPTEHKATVAAILLEYVRLMVKPWPLSYDYSPPYIRAMNWGSPAAIGGALLCLGSLILSIGLLRQRRRSGLAIVWFWVPLLPVCNLFFPVGTLLAERFLMLPSAGFCLLVGLGAAAVPLRYDRYRNIALLGIIVPWCVLTVVRNREWASNERLLTAAIVHTPNSARPHLSYGDMKVRAALVMQDTTTQKMELEIAATQLEHGLALHPMHYLSWHALGAAHFNLKNYTAAIYDYQVAQALSPNDAMTRQNLAAAMRMKGTVLLGQKQFEKAAKYLTKAYELSPDSTILPLLEQAKFDKN